MAKQIDNQNTGVKPNPGQESLNKPASKPTYVPPGHEVTHPSGRADDPSRKMEFDTSGEK